MAYVQPKSGTSPLCMDVAIMHKVTSYPTWSSDYRISSLHQVSYVRLTSLWTWMYALAKCMYILMYIRI